MLYLSHPYPIKIYQKWFCLAKIANKKKSEELYKKSIANNPLSSFPFLKLFHIVENKEYKIELLIRALFINPKDNIAYDYLHSIVDKLNSADLLKNSSVYFNIKKKKLLDFEFTNINEKQKNKIRNLDVFLTEHSLYSISLKLFYSSKRPGKIFCISNNGKITLEKEHENKILDFVLDKNNNLILGSIHKLLSDLESFVHGAGRIKIIDGKIVYIDNWSGHYRPTISNFYFTLYLLDKNGYDLSCCHALNFEPVIQKESVHKKNYINAFYKKFKLY